VQSPFGGTAVKVNAAANATTTIEAENFDNGGEGLAYHDVDVANHGGNTYRGTAGVDVASVAGASGGRGVNYIKAGEWLEYTVSVPTAGSYTLGARIAPLTGGSGTFHIEVDGVDKTGALVARGAASGPAATVFQSVGKDGVTLSAGTHVLRFKADVAGPGGVLGTLDAITVTAAPLTVDATRFAAQGGATVDGNHIGSLAQGDYVRYNGVNFGSGGATHFAVDVAAPAAFAGGQISVVQASTGKVLALLTVRATGSWDTYTWQSTTMAKVTGVQDIYLTFSGSGWVGNVQALRFW
jgi:hypothetical protein